MTSTNKVFVSPGIYTSEVDISTVTRQVGVTTLGLVGETTKGPAFQPIFITDYSEFKTFFGGLNPEKVKDTGYAKYELPYIAKSFLTNSNQLYVTRVLGLSGYNAGPSWGISTLGSDADKIVVLLRSRAKYDGSESLKFSVSGTSDLGISTSGATTNPLGDFTLTGSTSSGLFSYNVSLDVTSKNFISRVLGTKPETGKSPIYVEEIYTNTIKHGVANSGFTGISQTLVNDATRFSDYKSGYSPATSPYVVSEVNGNIIKKLFRFITISDGNSANSEIKISIANIKPDNKEFDVYIRAFSDTDANPLFLEKFSRCTMDPTSNNFIGRRIGTLDGFYPSVSNYVLVELDTDENTTNSFPGGFTGIPRRVYASSTNMTQITYNKSYPINSKKRKIYLGVSDYVGIDQDFFNYKGNDPTVLSGVTDGFHLDVDASGATLSGYTFVTGDSNFQTDAQLALVGNSYNKLYTRKFTFAPYGGFDGWDVYRGSRTNTDSFAIGGTKSTLGLGNNFISRITTTGEAGSTSDYYAYFEAIRTFKNPEEININVLSTPGIDVFNNTLLVGETIDMVEGERADSIYIATIPDYENNTTITPDDVVNRLDATGIDSNYTALYWPWVQVNDTENNVLIYLPPTRDVCRNIALTDNKTFPWFATAGIDRGNVEAIKARKKLTLGEMDVVYGDRINPIATFASEGIKIWGNKTLQIKESALDRLNVRRLLLQARKLISAVSIRLLFEENDALVRNQFKSLVSPILENIRTERGLTDFRVEVDNSPESIDRNELVGRIFIKPSRALEFITVEFTVTSTGASFENI